jgi:tRNA modification GTPase
MRSRQDDTIAARATPPGAGALAVIRLSGPAALGIADDVFRGASPLSASRGYAAHFGRMLSETGTELDDVVATVFRCPLSYTGEDMVEFSCHGGSLMAARALRALIACGARQADPGEFTRRAFLNGRMDLAQAEAVAELIAAGSERGQRASLEQLHGALSRRIARLKQDLVDTCGLLELNLDFIEEKIEIINNEEIADKIANVMTDIEGILGAYSGGRRLREGLAVSIVGPTNAGKSSIFNRLLSADRAIVTPQAGTTRDMLEENISIGGYLFRLRDTAGMRATIDIVEREGMKRSEIAISTADILLVVSDCAAEKPATTKSWVENISSGQIVINLLNKVDLVGGSDGVKSPHSVSVCVSALTGEGFDTLKDRLVASASELTGSADENGISVNERHRGALERALGALAMAHFSARGGISHEFVAMDLRGALTHLAEVTGEITTDEILESVFSFFCIGK